MVAPKLNKYLRTALVSLRTRRAYPGDTLGPLFTFCLIFFVQNRVWIGTFAGKELIDGYSQVQISWYLLVTELIVFSASGFYADFSREILSGQIAYTLGRPWSFPVYQWSARMGGGVFSVTLMALPGILIASLAVGLPALAGPWQLLFFLPAMALGMGIQVACQMLLGLSAFWLEENSAVYWIWSKLVLLMGTLLPLEFLPAFWQDLVRWTPLPWIMWAPARLLVRWPGLEQALGMVACQVLCLGLVSLVLALVWRLGTRRVTIMGG